MIKPDTLMALFATCDDDAWLGRICRAIGGQEVKLDSGQKAMFATIKAQKERDRKKAHYSKTKGRKK